LAKIINDKYYTPQPIVDLVIQKTKKIIGLKNITEFIEPSAGNGAFLDKLYETSIPTKAYDLYPERKDIIQQDFLKLDLEYKKGRCIIGNPPYGKGNYLSVKFYKKSILQCDYIVYILPISQLNNNMYMYEFDLIYSEDLRPQIYSGRKIHCCLNIYKRNKEGNNKKPNFDLEDLTLKGVATGKSRNDKVPKSYDFSICGFGSSIGKFCDYEGQYCQQIYFKINNKKHYEAIVNILKNTNWKSLYNMVSTPKLNHWMINKYLKEQITGLK